MNDTNTHTGYTIATTSGVVIAEVTHTELGTTDTIGGYNVPVDPMDLLGCDSCE